MSLTGGHSELFEATIQREAVGYPSGALPTRGCTGTDHEPVGDRRGFSFEASSKRGGAYDIP